MTKHTMLEPNRYLLSQMLPPIENKRYELKLMKRATAVVAQTACFEGGTQF